ncbi:Bug family tripartite tricarboxylate transporter substrate binding protein [Marinobacterium rhizophilum]|uniref:Bug family tripartite tricarboxylate transporter substrate binding protein n=1 Tax=Marinobacterium rhizophilum TaxID=420402 RepID=UPI000375FBFA|nr:tripartite tricarboxylate transporter substrate binding protein [Marinobacterium rhizophilum]
MKTIKTVMQVMLLAVAATVGLSSVAQAEYPERRIQIINPWAPGDSEDIIMRKAAEHMSEALGVPVKVINRTGGGGVVGASALASSRPDGYTFGILTQGPAITQVVMDNTTYGLDDFQPVGLFLDYPFVLATRSDEPYNSVHELAEYVKSGKTVTLGGFARLAVPSLVARLAAEKEGFDFSRDISLDPVNTLTLSTGDADVITLPEANGVVQDENAKAILAMTNQRISILPQVPTFKEVYGQDASIWAGLFGPKNVPDAALEKISAAFQHALQQDDIQAYAKSSGAHVYFLGAGETTEQMHQEADQFKQLIDKLGLQ